MGHAQIYGRRKRDWNPGKSSGGRFGNPERIPKKMKMKMKDKQLGYAIVAVIALVLIGKSGTQTETFAQKHMVRLGGPIG
jgi:hypothetical protein